GLFWKKTSTNAALVVVILAIPLSTLFKFATPWIPFLDRMGLGFLILSVLIVAISLWENKGNDPKAIRFTPGLFKTNAFFNISALIVLVALVIIYSVFW
ncbi:MAG: sodium/glucose cotransporter, partial [Bacteroidota bacterium]